MDRFTRRSSWGRLESSCFSNCGQSPPEITATLTIPRRSCSSADISASSDDLLSASVPSRSYTISFFTMLPASEFLRSIRVPGPASHPAVSSRKLSRQRNFQQVHFTERPESTRSDYRRQEQYVAFSNGICGATVLDLPGYGRSYLSSHSMVWRMAVWWKYLMKSR